MTHKQLCKSAALPVLLAGPLSGIGSGCKKNGNPPKSGSDTTTNRIEIYGTSINAGDTAILIAYFPNPESSGSTLTLDGVTSGIQYLNSANARSYSQSAGNAQGTIQFISIDGEAQTITAAFSGTMYKYGFETGSSLTVTGGEFTTNYSIH
jgi:hypothetical protein